MLPVGDLPPSLSPSLSLMMQPLITPCQTVLTSAQTLQLPPSCLFLIFFFHIAVFPPTECDSNALPRSTQSTMQAKQIWPSCLSQELECQLGKTSSYSVWKGMRVITQTDRHKNTRAHTKLQEMQLWNQRHKHTHTHCFCIINRLRQRFHVVSQLNVCDEAINCLSLSTFSLSLLRLYSPLSCFL